MSSAMLVVALMVPASASTPLQPDTTLPGAPAPAGPLYAPSAGTAYSMYSYAAPLGEYELHALSDGSAVRDAGTVQTSYAGLPRLSGSVLLRTSFNSDGLRLFTGEDPATGSVAWTITVPSTDTPVAVTGGGVVTTRGQSGALHELTTSGGDVDTGITANGFSPVLASDARTVVLQGPIVSGQMAGNLYALDLATGTAPLLTSAAGYSPTATLSATRVFWESTWKGSSVSIGWSGRDGAAGGTADIPAAFPSFTASGDTLLNVVQGGPDLSLRAVDVDAAALGPVLASHVGSYTQDGNGDLFLMLRDTATGRTARLASDGTLTQISLLPQLYKVPRLVRNAHGRVVVSYFPDSSSDQTSDAVLTSAPGDSSWSAGPAGQLVDAQGDAILTNTTPLATLATYVITAPGVSRQVKGNLVTLERGGQLYSVQYENGSSNSYTRRVDTGAVVPLPSFTSNVYTITGTWLWTYDSGTNVLNGVNLLDISQVLAVPVGLPCDAPFDLGVAGRTAVLTCSATEFVVVDLGGSQDSFTLPRTGALKQRSVGDGYVVQPLPDGAGGAGSLLVTDAFGTHEQREYGPATGECCYSYGTTYSGNDSGAPGITFLSGADTSGANVHYADLTWLSTPPVALDRFAPTLLSATATSSPTTSTTIGLAWSYADPSTPTDSASGIAAYETRTRWRGLPSGAFSDWTAPVPQPSPSATTTATPSSQTCWEVRAQDVAGNWSGWSADRCTTVDGATPKITKASVGAPVVSSVATSTVRFAFAATDDVAVANYDVQVRTAAAGKALGAAQYPAAWQHTTGSSVNLNVAPGGQACFAARARDAAGRLSAWSALSCAATPVDDRALVATGAVVRTTSSLALGHTVSRLSKPGSQLRSGSQTARRLAIVALMGPGQGVIDIYVGSTRVARVNLAATRTSRAVLTVRGANGVVSIRDVAGTASIDALASLRT